MKAHNRLFIVSMLGFLGYGISTIINPHNTSSLSTFPRKKMAVITCEAGMAHKRTTETIQALYEKENAKNGKKQEIEVITIDFLRDIFKPLDPFQQLSSHFPLKYLFKKPICAQDVYNYLLQKRWLFIANNLLKAGTKRMKNNHHIEKLVDAYLEKENPDIVVSVIPLMNHGILRACRKKNIPFLLTTLDLNPTYWANGLTAQDCAYEKFIYALPFNDHHLKKATQKNQVFGKALTVTGYPLQDTFYKKYDSVELKKKYNIDSKKPVVMLMMGGIGSSAIIAYARRVMRMKLPLHLIICLGKSAHLLPEIKNLRLSPYVTYTAFTYTNEIPQLMSISNLIITKAGANSVAEAMQMNLPMLLDKTTIFDLERKNIDFITKHKFGEAIKSYNDIEKLLRKYLTNERLLESLRNNMRAFKTKNFQEVLPPLVDALLYKDRNSLTV